MNLEAVRAAPQISVLI